MNGLLTSTNTWLKKQFFNGAHLLDVLANQDDKFDEGDVYMFALRFERHEQKQALALYQSLLWFTYRDGLCFEGHPDIQSDIGWGCMLRVGQMMLAHALRMHKGQDYYLDQKYLPGLLSLFLEPNASFSIEKFCQIGKQFIGKKPGEWYSTSDIAFIIQQSLAAHRKECKQGPLWVDMEVVVTDTEFSAKGIFDQLQVVDKGKPFVHRMRPCLLIVLGMLGFQRPEEERLEKVVRIMKEEPNFVGMLGGRPGKAHFLMGSTEKSFLYLDPHCVKAQTGISGFMCDTMLSIPHQRIDPSTGLCFYFRNLAQMLGTHSRLKKMAGDLIYCHGQEQFAVTDIEDDEQFQVLGPN